VVALFSVTAFLSAALLFLVQPMLGKALLPRAGGSPAVWTTCMLFFQAALLAGYACAHAVARRIPPRAQTWVVGAALAVALAFSWRPRVLVEVEARTPVLALLLTLGASIGVVFVGVSTLSPTLQRWFASSGHRRSADPYFLSIASNAGSAVGLLAYPLVFERTLASGGQWRAWTVLLGVLILLVVACGATAARRSAPTPGAEQPADADTPTARTRLHWIALAFAPSSLVLGATQHISTDIAAVPLLWVLPLLLYLVSFMLAFAGGWAGSSVLWGRVLPIVLLPLAAALLIRARTPAVLIISLHMVVLLVASTMCHRRLAELRPHPSRLTEFYLLLAAGGVLGGVCNALVAPQVFDRVYEYPIALACAVLLRPQIVTDWRNGAGRPRTWAVWGALGAIACATVAFAAPRAAERAGLEDWTLKAVSAGVPCLLLGLLLLGGGSTRFSVALLGVLLISTWEGVEGRVLARSRTFFGVHQVVRSGTGRWHMLMHGTTLHGVQVAPTSDDHATLRETPTTYYHRSGPIGDVIAMLKKEDRFKHAAFIGLGGGTMAAYAEPGSIVKFFEIDPAVIRFAQDERLLTYVADARARGADIDIIEGDGRLSLAREEDGAFDLVAIDAFSSDAIPVHLMTLEAARMYLSKTNEHGVVAFHVSNRSFHLAPVLVRIAHELGLVVAVRNDALITSHQRMEAKSESDWVVLARRWEDLGDLAKATTWDRPWRLKQPPDGPLWTDDRSDVLNVFTGW
jgi:spermidine synthase